MTVLLTGDTGTAPDGPHEPSGPRGPDTVLPLTAAQTSAWQARPADPGGPAQHLAECVEIAGPLDPAVFAAALRRVTAETDALRVRIEDSPEGPVQRLAPSADPALTVHDLRGAPDADRRAEAWMRADLDAPCDPAAGPLFGHALFRVGEERWLWYLRVHHLVMDAYGCCLLVRRTAEAHSALARGGDPGRRPFGTLTELVAQDAGYRASGAFDADRAHWSAAFAGRPETAGLTGRVAPPSGTFLRRTAHLGPRTTERVRELATLLRATWPEVTIAAQALCLSTAADRPEVVIGLPMPGRVGPVALRVPGMVTNVLPLRLTVAPGTTFPGLVRQVVLGVRRTRSHQRYRCEDIHRDLRLPDGARGLVGPRVHALPFDYAVDFAGSPARARNLSAGPVEDLTVGVHDRADGRGLRVDHDGHPALYDEAALAAHQERFLHLLERFTGGGPHTRPLA